MQQNILIDRSAVARGAFLAMLSRGGAVIEALAQPLYIWLFGLSGYGIFVALWAVMNLTSKIMDLSMTSALQRLIPGEKDAERIHAILRSALLIGVLPTVAMAAVVHSQAPAIIGYLSLTTNHAIEARTVILFAWALPLWTFLEVATSAVRAQGAFGPEIRLRIFWEQAMRIGLALVVFQIVPGAPGLAMAYVGSLCLAALLAVRLLSRHYDLKLLLRAPRAAIGPIVTTGLALMPTNLSRRLLIDAPPMLLVALIPAGGAMAAGLFEVARKISTVPQVVKQAFYYVLAPLSAAQARRARADVQPLYSLACRLSTALAIPLAGFIACAGRDILSVYRQETLAAWPALCVLVAARGIEAMIGPAGAVVEVIGHRLLPLVNSVFGIAVWLSLAVMLTPAYGLVGMTIAIGAGTIVIAAAAALELRWGKGMRGMDRWIANSLASGLLGTGFMIGTAYGLDGPGRFLVLLLLWIMTSWVSLRIGLDEIDRIALGTFGTKLRLSSRGVADN